MVVEVSFGVVPRADNLGFDGRGVRLVVLQADGDGIDNGFYNGGGLWWRLGARLPSTFSFLFFFLRFYEMIFRFNFFVCSFVYFPPILIIRTVFFMVPQWSI